MAFGIVLGVSVFGMAWGLVNTLLIRSVNMDDYSHLRKEHDAEEKGLINAEGTGHEGQALLARMKHISDLITKGAITFLR